MRRDTLLDFFHDLSAMRGEFLVYDDGYRTHSYTYEQVVRAARGFAARLTAAGLRKGDTVVFWGENRPEWIACYWGCLLAGVVVVPIDYRAPADFLAKVRALVDARIVLTGEDVPRPAADAMGPAVELWPLAALDWHADAPLPVVDISRDDITQIIFTSGATSEPKGVVIRHRNLLANLVPVEREVLKYRKYGTPFFPIRFLNLLPLSHLFGQSMATTIPPLVQGTVVFTRSFNPHDLVALVRKRRVSVIVCVPKILDVLRDHVLRLQPGAEAPLPRPEHFVKRWWRYRTVHRAFGLKFWAFVVGAAPLPGALEEFWKKIGFVVVQGYGLTETAPIVTLNNPFKTTTGSVGTPIAGVDVRIADDGEILVRGENVSSGYFKPGADTGRTLNHEGWLHTGDVGELDAEGRLFIRGRKKEMIITPEGLNVFPDDVEAVLNQIAGVTDSAVVGIASGGEERVHAVLVLEPGADLDAIVREANTRLLDHQRIRNASVWPTGDLPRTEGTRKLKRVEIKRSVETGAPARSTTAADPVAGLLAQFAGSRMVRGGTTIEELGLSSLERVELMVALEDRFQTRLDETKFAQAKSLDDLRALLTEAPTREVVAEPVEFPSWNRSWPVRLVRRASLATWILPLARLFAWVDVRGLEQLRGLDEPVVFAANHQSHFDVPVILAALPGHLRARVAPAMAKEFFTAHFFPAGHTWRERLTNGLNYYLAAFFFNAFPLPQREAGARQTLRYIGELTGSGWSVLIFPEGERSATGRMKPFRGGIGMIASRLDVPVVPVRLDDVDRVLSPSAKFPTPGRVRVTFGAPLRLAGDDYGALARRVEEAVRALGAFRS